MLKDKPKPGEGIYTFLKRPVILVDGQIFVGNSKKTVQAAKEALHP